MYLVIVYHWNIIYVTLMLYLVYFILLSLLLIEVLNIICSLDEISQVYSRYSISVLSSTYY